jgi:hypothetical protein
MLTGRVFISYRRDDSAGYARLLYDRLNARFPNQVFMDVTGIEAGADFVEVIEQAIGSCAALVVLIGRQWLAGAGAGGRRRLDDPADFVRLEIAAALKKNIRVIPVLLRGAAMPAPEELPPDLSPLARRQAIELSDADFDHDIERLIRAIERDLGEAGPHGTQASARRYWLVTAGVVLISAIIALSAWLRDSEGAPHHNLNESPSPQATAASDVESSIKTLSDIFKNLPATSGGTPPQPSGPETQPFQFDAVGRWLVTAQGLVSGNMQLNLKADHTYEISNPAGALSILGQSGTWTYDPKGRRLALLPSGDAVGLGIYIKSKQNDNFHAQDPSGVTYVFHRP